MTLATAPATGRTADENEMREFRKALALACNDPGHFVGFKGERSLGDWQADALLSGPLAPILQEAATARKERDALSAIVMADDAKALAEYEWERANKLAEEAATLRARLQEAEKDGEARGADPGRAAYEARFAHARPRDVEPWDGLTPDAKVIWARVEAKSRGQVVAPDDVREALTEAVRQGLSEPSSWISAEPSQIADELIAGPLANLVASAAESDRWGSEYADAMDARMEDAAHMETLRVALTVLAECKIGSGLHAVRKWFVDGMRGPIPWPEGTLFAAWAAGHEIFDCNGAMGFRRGDLGRAA